MAHKTAATSALLHAVAARAAESPARFTLLVPNPAHGLHRVVDAEDQTSEEGQSVLRDALPRLEQAAGSAVEGIVGVANPLDAIQDAVNVRGFDEIIISTLPARISKWLHLDLPAKVGGLGLPVTTVTAREDVRV